MSRNRHLLLSALLVASVAAGAASAQPAPEAPPPAATPLGSGPYKALMEVDPSLPTHTIYRPANLAALAGERLPVVVWGNGACVNRGNAFRDFLTEIASYGYLVIALGPIDESPRTPTALPPRVEGQPRILPPPETHPVQLIQAIDWAVKEGARAGGAYRGLLRTDRIAVMGQSCGGVQAIEASADPRVTTTVIWNSGMPIGGTNMAGGKPMLTKDDLKPLHAPIAYISGDAQDVAFANANDDFEKISWLPVFRGWERGVPHAGTYRQPGGGEFGGVAVAWLNWRLKDDQKSARMFSGADCGLCVNPRWVVQRKQIP